MTCFPFELRVRATAEQCLQHPWLHSEDPQETETRGKRPPLGVHDASSASGDPTGSPESPTTTTTTTSTTCTNSVEEEDESPVTEDLIVVAAYTLGQCRQSSTAEKDARVADKKANSKRFKFEEPFTVLQEVPGEFIY